MELAEYLAVPYMLVVHSVELPDGSWVRRAEYPELPGCVAEARDVLTAIDELEAQRVRYLARAFLRHEEIPVPRPPLRSGSSGLNERPVAAIVSEVADTSDGA